MRILVQKFGGTSVATKEARARAAGYIMDAKGGGFAPVVVVSAMGRYPEPYATDTLLEMAGPIALREKDLLQSCGEIIAGTVLAGTLEQEGCPCAVLTGVQAGIVTDGRYADARVIRVEPERILRLLDDGLVTIVAGFQGASPEGEVNTLGRGGSDTTAAALGVALGAQSIDIFTDVDGIKTADPKLVPGAKTIEAADYDEIFQMANQGAKVIHPRAVEIARQGNTPLRIRSTFGEGEGTLVARRTYPGDLWSHRKPDRAATGVTYLNSLVQFVVELVGAEEGVAEVGIFADLAQAGISLDLINVQPGRKAFAVKREEKDATEKVLEASGYPYRILDDCAKVSLVGSAIHGLPGVMANVVAALNQEKIKILGSSDSHSTISCLVRETEIGAAVRALHRQFNLE